MNVTGAPVRLSGGAHSVSGLHTVAITANNLQGRVYVEATLAVEPGDSDWFSVAPYVEFPTAGATSPKQTVGVTFSGNLTWVRARLDRTYLADPAADPTPYGYIDHVDICAKFWGD